MQYTLDSVVQVEGAIKTMFPNHKIDRVSIVKKGAELSEMVENPNIYYFGLLAVPPGVTAVLTNRGDEVMTVEPGSQIIEFFSSVRFEDPYGAEIAPKGQFRGFSIQVQAS